MKWVRKYILLFLMLLIVIGLVYSNYTIQAQDQSAPKDECAAPTQTISISTSQDSLSYDKSQISAPKNTCVKLEFRNPSDVSHDFTVDLSDGSPWIYLYLENKDDAQFGSEPGLISMNIQTPDLDVTYTYYCSVPGHRVAGEEGKFIIGEGTQQSINPTDTSSGSTDKTVAVGEKSNDEPSLPFLKFYIVLTTLFVIIKVRKRHLIIKFS